MKSYLFPGKFNTSR